MKFPAEAGELAPPVDHDFGGELEVQQACSFKNADELREFSAKVNTGSSNINAFLENDIVFEEPAEGENDSLCAYNGEIKGCYQEGIVSGYQFAGGIFGSIGNCYFVGTESSEEAAGAVCGNSYGTITE